MAHEDAIRAIRSEGQWRAVRVGDTIQVPIPQTFRLGRFDPLSLPNFRVKNVIVTPELLVEAEEGLRSKTEQVYVLSVLKRDSR